MTSDAGDLPLSSTFVAETGTDGNGARPDDKTMQNLLWGIRDYLDDEPALLETLLEVGTYIRNARRKISPQLLRNYLFTIQEILPDMQMNGIEQPKTSALFRDLFQRNMEVLGVVAPALAQHFREYRPVATLRALFNTLARHPHALQHFQPKERKDLEDLLLRPTRFTGRLLKETQRIGIIMESSGLLTPQTISRHHRAVHAVVAEYTAYLANPVAFFSRRLPEAEKMAFAQEAVSFCGNLYRTHNPLELVATCDPSKMYTPPRKELPNFDNLSASHIYHRPSGWSLCVLQNIHNMSRAEILVAIFHETIHRRQNLDKHRPSVFGQTSPFEEEKRQLASFHTTTIESNLEIARVVFDRPDDPDGTEMYRMTDIEREAYIGSDTLALAILKKLPERKRDREICEAFESQLAILRAPENNIEGHAVIARICRELIKSAAYVPLDPALAIRAVKPPAARRLRI